MAVPWFLNPARKTERVMREVILSDIRAANISDLHKVEAVVLETGADLHVIMRADGRAETLKGVSGAFPAAHG